MLDSDGTREMELNREYDKFTKTVETVVSLHDCNPNANKDASNTIKDVIHIFEIAMQAGLDRQKLLNELEVYSPARDALPDNLVTGGLENE